MDLKENQEEAVDLDLLLEKYRNGEASRQEVRDLASFLETDKHEQAVKRKMGRDIKAHFDNEFSPPNPADETFFQSILEKTDFPRSKKILSLNPLYARIGRLAGAVVLLLSFFGVLYFYVSSDSQEQVFVSKRTPFKQITHIKFPDESEAWLKAGSYLKYPKQFLSKDKNRPVYLEGEAFFKIKPNPNQPFVVNTKKIKTRVLGTSFNVQAYETTNQFTVVVEAGMVEVDQKNLETGVQKMTLTKNEMVSLSEKNILEIRSGIDLDVVMAWMDGNFVFRDMGLETVVMSLEQWFGVDIELEEKNLSHCKVSGKYLGQDLDLILDALEQILGVNYTYVGDNKQLIKLSGGDCVE